MSNKPVKRFKSSVSYGLSIAVWQNENGATFSIQKTYKDKNSGEYKESKSLFANDLAAIALLAPEAIAYADSLKSREPVQQDTRELVGLPSGDDLIPSHINTDDIPF